MGGNALKQYNVIRLSAAEYHKLAVEVYNKLTSVFPEYRFDIIPAYENKDSFGDMDILFSHPNTTDFFLTIIKTLNPIGYCKNGNVLSISYPIDDKLFQIDLIKSLPKDHDFSLKYFSYNDLGNLMGRIYHKMGLKFGFTGLLYVIRDPENTTTVIKEILITNDWDYVINLGKFSKYDSTQFKNLRDVFEYVITSPYFNSQIFLLDNRNHISRVRDRKRSSYMSFLSWIKNKPNLPSCDWSNSNIKEIVRNQLFTDFPEFHNEYVNLITAFKRNKELHKKYNGSLVMEWIGLEGRELGAFMQSVKDIITPEFIEDNDMDVISEKVKELYRNSL